MPRSRDSGRLRERAWIEVDSGALARNLGRIRDSVGSRVKLIPMVKADAYGLGVERVVAALGRVRPFGFGVATVEEGIQLRRLGVEEPVMVYCPVPPSALGRAVEGGLVPVVSDLGGLATLRELAASGRAPGVPVPFQIEVDTGMGRAGFPLSGGGGGWWSQVRSAPDSGLRLFGVFTHLHSADEPDVGSARTQVERFEQFVRGVEGIPPDALVHYANSAGALRLPSRIANAARPGIYLYGGRAGPGGFPEPVVAVRARVALVRDVLPGTTLGYGATYRSAVRETWATVGIGYGDGLPRTLGNRGRGIVHGGMASIVGRISMDTTVVRLRRGGRVSSGDIVTFIGRDDGAALPLDEVADQAGTIAYEILTMLSPRLPRLMIES